MLYLVAFLLNEPIPVAQTGISWLGITQTVIAGLMLAGVIALVKFGIAVDNWHHSNENRIRSLERARRRHRGELDHVGDFLEETHPGKFRRRASDGGDD